MFLDEAQCLFFTGQCDVRAVSAFLKIIDDKLLSSLLSRDFTSQHADTQVKACEAGKGKCQESNNTSSTVCYLSTPRLSHLLSQSFGGGPFDGQLGSVLYGGGLLGEAEVADLGIVVVRHQHVTSCQVSMDEVVGLQVLHGFTHITVTGEMMRGGWMTKILTTHRCVCIYYFIYVDIFVAVVTTSIISSCQDTPNDNYSASLIH